MIDIYLLLTAIVVIVNVFVFAYIIETIRKNPKCEDVDDDYDDMDKTITQLNMNSLPKVVNESDFK